MPAAEADIDHALVRALLNEQHPDLAGEFIRPLAFGWDNLMYRVGEELVARLPRRQLAVDLIEHEQRWLPGLAPSLPLPIPAPVRTGRPGCGYPWPWSIVPWLPGTVAAIAPPSDPVAAAEVLGRFVRALHQPAPADAPANPFRGVPLTDRNAWFYDGVKRLGDQIDGATALARWEGLVQTPPWPGPPFWLHGDLHAANVLVSDGRVSAVVDFGDITAGDPATDLIVAWMLLPTEVHQTFRAAAGVDDDTWARGTAWALALAVTFLNNSADNRLMADMGVRTFEAVLA
jgi:aminoglycoside phosphotransferase (APT) family kinase protein